MGKDLRFSDGLHLNLIYAFLCRCGVDTIVIDLIRLMRMFMQ